MANEYDVLKKELEENKAHDEEMKNQAEEKAEDSSESKHRHHHHHHHHHHSGKKGKHRRHHRHHRRHRNKKRVRRVLLYIGILFLLAVAVVVGSLFAMRKEGEFSMVAKDYNITAPENLNVNLDDKGDYVTYNGERYKYNNDIINILFLGIDKKNSSDQSKQIGENRQSDVITLCSINKSEKKIVIFNVPRDIITDISVFSPGGEYVGREKMPIALAYAYGDGKAKSCLNSIDAVSRLFYNLPVKTYFSMNLDGVAPINDSVGGVDVKSPETIGEFVEGEQYHLMGAQASDFIQLRSKETADANLKRNERQRVYMNAFLTRFMQKTKSDISVPIDLFNASKPYSCTNLNADKITYLATEFIFNRSMKFQYETVPVDVKQAGDRAENYVKEKEFYEKFLSAFYTKV